MANQSDSYQTTKKLLKDHPELADKLGALVALVRIKGRASLYDLEFLGFTSEEIELLEKSGIIKKISNEF